MISQLWEMFEGYSAEMCGGKIPLVPMGVRVEGSACADTGARTPIGTRGNFINEYIFSSLVPTSGNLTMF